MITIFGNKADKLYLEDLVSFFESQDISAKLSLASIFKIDFSNLEEPDILIVYLSPDVDQNAYKSLQKRRDEGKTTINLIKQNLNFSQEIRSAIGANPTIFQILSGNNTFNEILTILEQHVGLENLDKVSAIMDPSFSEIPNQKQEPEHYADLMPEESSNKTKVWIGVILAAIITGGGIWGYKAYIGNSAGEEQVETASNREDSTDKNTPIAIIRSSGSETFRLFDLDGEPFGPTIDWEIDWPEGGEASIRNKIKAEIIRMLELKMPNGKTVDNVTPEELFQETVKRYKEEYEEFKTPAQYEEERGAVFWCDGEECEATVEIWDDALINITTHSTPNIMNGAPYTQTLNELILLETGESWKPSLLPSDSQLLPLVIKQWVRLGYPQNAVSAAGNALLDVDSRYWTKEGLTFFYWKPWGLDIPDVDWMVEVTIPYRELLPVLSSDAKRFIMPSILE